MMEKGRIDSPRRRLGLSASGNHRAVGPLQPPRRPQLPNDFPREVSQDLHADCAPPQDLRREIAQTPAILRPAARHAQQRVHPGGSRVQCLSDSGWVSNLPATRFATEARPATSHHQSGTTTTVASARHFSRRRIAAKRRQWSETTDVEAVGGQSRVQGVEGHGPANPSLSHRSSGRVRYVAQ